MIRLMYKEDCRKIIDEISYYRDFNKFFSGEKVGDISRFKIMIKIEPYDKETFIRIEF